MISIYDLSLQGLEIESLLLESAGEITPEIQERMDLLLLSGPEAMESAAAVVTQLMMSAKMAEEESDRLRARSKEFEEQARQLKERMLVALDTAFGGKIKTPKWSIWTQKAADRTVADLVPGITPEMLHAERPDLVRVKMELNREKVVADWKAGQPLPELILFEERKGEKYVRIK
jgi:cell division protein ZapA (FtsZ GTPase activity inhibitor)